MAETPTEEEELNRIAQKSYGKDYYGLCGDRQVVVRRLYATENI